MAIFTVRKDKRYSATIELNWVERLASNDRIARYLHEAGFTKVEVSGNGATRSATALWPHADRMGEVPPQITAIDEIEVWHTRHTGGSQYPGPRSALAPLDSSLRGG